ncbi:hypothetical protein [Burkholderia orbicola]|uniref:hypothetical protein n=1 Tax=Burkholderia orbicola TaxID=2978683 RepID=UPI002FDF7473
MLEKTVETYLVDRVRAAGGDAYKFSSPARVSVPDRIVIFPPARIYFVELKRPGGVVTKGQLREHERLRALGCDVRVIDSREGVDAFVQESLITITWRIEHKPSCASLNVLLPTAPPKRAPCDCGAPLISTPSSSVRQFAATPGGHCERAGGCVCGGDLPRVREGCPEWVKSGGAA